MSITHPQLVAALVKPGQDIIDSLTPQKAHLWHMASALLGEVAELADALSIKENIVEELGDVEFYLEGFRAAMEWELVLPQISQNFFDLPQAFHFFHTAAGNLFDFTKKYVIYNKDLAPETVGELMDCHRGLAHIYYLLGLDRRDVLAANIAKLSKRYKDLTYSDKSAQERKDKIPDLRAETLFE